MALLAERIELKSFNVTEKQSLFSKPEFGALYIPPVEGFSEVTQKTLCQMARMNQLKPHQGYKNNYQEFYPEDIFIERSFSEINLAEQFIKDFFHHFKNTGLLNYEDVISNFRKFIEINEKAKNVQCRIELISGDSCRKFHVDYVESRLIYTLGGPGTQIKHAKGEEFITLPTGSAVIVKGYKFPDFKLTTLHRSPPIAEKNLKRLLFIADYL